jgi:hypothetical protein
MESEKRSAKRGHFQSKAGSKGNGRDSLSQLSKNVAQASSEDVKGVLIFI